MLGPLLVVLAGVLVLVALGTWQLDRRAWKESLIARLESRLGAPAAPMPSPSAWPALDAAADEFRRVSFTATFRPNEEAFIFTPGSALRQDVTSAGYWVLSPARLQDGAKIVINRGYVPERQRDPSARNERIPAGPVTLVGVLRWPEPRNWFTPADEPAKNLWFVRDPAAIAAAKGWGAVAPFYIDLESPVPPTGLPRPGRLAVNLPNNHLQYALTWYGLAATLALVFLFWLRQRRREARP
jgi:surfeit locus 1 family protein